MLAYENCNPQDFDTLQKKRNLEFEISDLVLVKDHDEYMDVVGVIHDDELLYVCCSTKQEFEVPFSDVDAQYKLKEI